MGKIHPKSSYTSAGSFPVKLLAHVSRMLTHGIRPIHPQIYLTSRCQLSCDFCSCKERDKAGDIDVGLFKEYVSKLAIKGARAVTITGGGEPLLHPDFPVLLGELKCLSYKVGMATNGIAIKDYDPKLFTEFDWIRISMDGKRDRLPEVPLGLKHAYSYVYRADEEIGDPLNLLIGKARKGAITHLRVVSDIIKPAAGRTLAKTLAKLSKDGDMPGNVIFQNRADSTPGSKDCWLSLLKPVIDVDGQIYPCCGAQYALRLDERRMPPEMSMGDLQAYLTDYVLPQRPFDGSKCRFCYYRKYNDVLALVKRLHDVRDVDFV
jgi:MoaA/NifB/PqqE/SkfB family radical SAM enzyme